MEADRQLKIGNSDCDEGQLNIHMVYGSCYKINGI